MQAFFNAEWWVVTILFRDNATNSEIKYSRRTFSDDQFEYNVMSLKHSWRWTFFQLMEQHHYWIEIWYHCIGLTLMTYKQKCACQKVMKKRFAFEYEFHFSFGCQNTVKVTLSEHSFDTSNMQQREPKGYTAITHGYLYWLPGTQIAPSFQVSNSESRMCLLLFFPPRFYTVNFTSAFCVVVGKIEMNLIIFIILSILCCINK